MDAATVITILTGLAGIGGGWATGRRGAVAQNSALAQSTIQMLESRLAVMEAEANKIPTLMARIATLEALATQRAEVEKVIEIIMRIEEKVDARP